METQKSSNVAKQILPDTSKQPDQKAYQTPVLVEWGSVKDLTKGSGLPGDDGTFGTTT
jgi:hypothetical protein